MARYTGPVCKLCRREGQKLMLKGQKCYTEKCPIERRQYPPGQHGPAQARRRNLRNAFSIRGRVNANHVLIVDDVMTTGETCRQLARVLNDGGVDEISVLAIARA